MLIKRLVAIGAATVALAGVGVAAAGPASATVETGRWCQHDWSGDWTVCTVEQTDPDGSRWYYGHGWNTVNQYIIVNLYDGSGNYLDTGDGYGWAATPRYQRGFVACIYDAIRGISFVCAERQ